jgi:hypothetical protein
MHDHESGIAFPEFWEIKPRGPSLRVATVTSTAQPEPGNTLTGTDLLAALLTVGMQTSLLRRKVSISSLPDLAARS